MSAEIFFPTLRQIREAINSLEGIDEDVARPILLETLNQLSGDEIALVMQQTQAEEFEAGYLLGLATARQEPRRDAK